ncbi:MAG: hypothetical protein AB7J35_09450 [Dehalococcoidia bacterium]
MTDKPRPDETPEALARAAIEEALSSSSDAPLVAASEMLLAALKDHPEWREFIEQLVQSDAPAPSRSEALPSVEDAPSSSAW